MMKANDVAPRARNFYVEEDYFSLNVRNGIIRSPTGVRVVTIVGYALLFLTWSLFAVRLVRGRQPAAAAEPALITA